MDVDAFQTLLPRLATEMVARHPGVSTIHETIDGSLLSADISGFTRLTEELADRGREGAEIITTTVNSCFEDLISAGEFHGGDVLKFGGDAFLMLFRGTDHEARAGAAGHDMQAALGRNRHAKRHQLLMTVGVADGPFDAMVVGGEQRDLLLCGPRTSETLRLEGAADKGEVLASRAIQSSLAVADDRKRSAVQPPTYVSDTDGSWPAFVPEELRAHWQDYADLGASHRQAAIGFVMIGGVDVHILRHGGDETARQMSNMLVAIEDVLRQSDTTLLHSDMAEGGLKLLVGAGVPSSVDAPADALLHAAVEIARLDSPFEIRQGLSIGTVFAGFLGATHRSTFTVMGDTVNTAARMLGPAEVGGIVAVETLVQRARAGVLGRQLEPLQVKGKSQLINARAVTGLRHDARERGEMRAAFGGRDDELAELQSAIAEGDAVTITGPAGSGKTRLRDEALGVETAMDSAGGRYLAASPYGAFWAAARRLVGIAPDAAPKDAGQTLSGALRTRHRDLAPLAALLAPIFNAEVDESAEVQAIDPEFRRDVLHRSFAEMLAMHTPTIKAVVIEDTQWLDDASRELIRYLELEAGPRGWAVVQSLRQADDDRDDASSEPLSGVEIALGPLSDAAIEAIIAQACERTLLRHELSALTEKAQGNPLFALELAASVGRPGEEIPDSIDEVIVARIDRLGSRERRAVRLASVLGARFQARTFEALVTATGYDVSPDITEIQDIFETADDLVRFRQLLYRDVAYASLPFARRKRLHRIIGEHLESTTEDVESIAGLLSEHFHAAGDRKRCWTHSLVAAERAVAQHSPADAAAMFERALGFAPRGTAATERAAASEGLGRALMAAGGLDEAHQAFGRARRLTESPADRLRIACLQADCRDRQGRFSDAMRTYTRVFNNTDARPGERCAALLGRSSVLHRLGRNTESYAAAHQALEVAQAARLVDGEAHALQLIGVSGEPVGAADHNEATERALRIYGETGALSAEAEIRNNMGVSAQLGGRLDEAADAYRASLELKQRVGDLAGAAMVQMNLAEVELDRGTSQGVDNMLASCLAVFERSGFTVGAAYTQGLRGRCALMRGDSEEAKALLANAAAVFGELGAEGHAADMDLMLVEALTNLGESHEAHRLLEINRERLRRDVFDHPQAAGERIADLAARLD